jgi:hypothetical protein
MAIMNQYKGKGGSSGGGSGQPFNSLGNGFGVTKK